MIRIMLIYSLSVTVTSIRLWDRVEACFHASELCNPGFSWPRFFGEVAVWFVALYIFMKFIIATTVFYKKRSTNNIKIERNIT